MNWYEKNKRSLPWRESSDPYAVWVSEIMLQQTRVDTVRDYYRRFLERFPTVQALAHSRLEDVLKAWEGLGYYSRARNMHQAAGEILEKHRGVFPQDHQDVLSLPGIGDYTAGAIMSIAFNKAYPAVDGNVVRVMSRLFLLETDPASGRDRGLIKAMLGEVFPIGKASGFTQSLMELGALVCLPASPRCQDCPVQSNCGAYQNSRQQDFPLRQKKPKQRKETRYIALIRQEDRVLMNQRSDQGLLGGLWEFPGVAGRNKEDFVQKFEQEYGLALVPEKLWLKTKHVFSHLIWEMKVYTCGAAPEPLARRAALQWIAVGDLDSVPIPTAFKAIKKKIRDEYPNEDKGLPEDFRRSGG